MKTIWLLLTNWCFTIISYIAVFLMPAYLIYYFFMDKTLGTPDEENGKAVIYFIISLIFSPVTIGGTMYLREKIDELLGVTFEERYNA